MSAAYKVLTIANVEQTEQDMSFKGGVPNIPDRFEVLLCVVKNCNHTPILWNSKDSC